MIWIVEKGLDSFIGTLSLPTLEQNLRKPVLSRRRLGQSGVFFLENVGQICPSLRQGDEMDPEVRR